MAERCKTLPDNRPREVVDPIMGESLLQRLQLEGYHAIWWRAGEEALEQFATAGCRVLHMRHSSPGYGWRSSFGCLPHLGRYRLSSSPRSVRWNRLSGSMRAGADDYIDQALCY